MFDNFDDFCAELNKALVCLEVGDAQSLTTSKTSVVEEVGDTLGSFLGRFSGSQPIIHHVQSIKKVQYGNFLQVHMLSKIHVQRKRKQKRSLERIAPGGPPVEASGEAAEKLLHSVLRGLC